MSLIQRLLLLPCLSPLLAALVVAGLNTGQPTDLRLLTWRSPRLPIGAWIAISAGGSALITALAALSTTAIAQPLRRQVHRPMGWSRREEGPGMPDPAPADHRPSSAQPFSSASAPQASGWPERDVRDPAPTVAVPFRVIKRGKPASSHAEGRASAQTKAAAATTPTEDDWDQPLSDDW